MVHTLIVGRRIGNDRHLSGTTSQFLYASGRRLIGGIPPAGSDHWREGCMQPLTPPAGVA